MSNIITTENLTKRFGRVCAVDGLSLNVREGEIYGFLGLNGAGKTTTIRMLLGMIRPTEGRATLLGRRVDAGAYGLWKDVGYLVEMPNAYPDLTVEENLKVLCMLYGLEGNEAIDRVVAELKLAEYRHRKAKNLSLGNAQRLGLAKALLHEPKLLLLDEPANGMDPAGIVEIRELLMELARDRGVTVFISSHILSEISKLATRIGIIHRGRMVQEVDTGNLDSLLKKRLLIDAADREKVLLALAGVGIAAKAADRGAIETTDAKALGRPEDVASLLVHAGCPPRLLKLEVEDLEAYFLRVTGGEEQ
jgi:ABC-2 type transport system ATP-binding protein